VDPQWRCEPDASVHGRTLAAQRIATRLFDPPSERAEAVARLKREVNHRHGRFALRSAATLAVPAI
jgi:uncharacterized protein (DUF924 family)